MGILREVIGQETADRLLSSSMKAGRLAHAYLFAGPSGTGRFTAALELAASWMCDSIEDGYCGKCRECTRIFEFRHPDVRVTVPRLGRTTPEELAELFSARLADGISPLSIGGNASITIDQVREMEQRLTLRSFENRGHIEIITEAHRMGIEAANSLLKTLEEPPDDTVMILISSSWSALLPTVRSRSHLIRFRRLPAESVSSIVMSRTGLGEKEALEIAMASDGSPGKALIAASSGMEVPAGEPVSVLTQVAACTRPSEVLTLAGTLSVKLKAEGALAIVRGLRSCIHDVRRVSLGLHPLAHVPGSLDGLAATAPAAEAAGEHFSRAEESLVRNGRVLVVLTSALLGFWREVHPEPSGRDVAS